MIFATPGEGSVIPISNPSFETPSLGGAGGTKFAFGVSGGWTDVGDVITWNNAAYTSSIPFSSIPDGNQVADLGAGGGGGESIAQTLSTNLAANTTYTLSFYVGAPISLYGAYGGYGAVLSAGGVTLASDTSGVTPSAGAFLQDTLVFNSADATSAQLAVIGDPLTITFLQGTAANGFGGDPAFDLVQLDGTANSNPSAPEPSTGLLLLTACGGFALYRVANRSGRFAARSR